LKWPTILNHLYETIPRSSFSCATCNLQGDPVSQPHEAHVPSLFRVGLQPCTHQVLVYAWTYSSKLALSFYCCAPWILEGYAVLWWCSIRLVWWTQTDWTVKHQVEHRNCWVHVWTFKGPFCHVLHVQMERHNVPWSIPIKLLSHLLEQRPNQCRWSYISPSQEHNSHCAIWH
jgi:hypothetical protein